MASALATCLLLLVSIYQNFLGSNVDRTVANAYIIRKELSNLRHAAFECKSTNFICILAFKQEKSEKKFGILENSAYLCSVRNDYPGDIPA